MAKKQASRPKARERAGLLSDQAISSLGDDRLGFAQYATALMSLIDLNLAETPVTIAISAPWGSGKTSLARLLEEQLAASPRVPPHTTCWFNAWDHVGASDVRAPLAATVARRASNARGLHHRILRPLPLSLTTDRSRSFRLALLSILVAVAILATLERLGTINVDARNKLGGASAGWLAVVAGVPLLTAVINAVNPFVGALQRYAARPASAADKGDLTTVRRQLAGLLRQVTRKGRKFLIIIDDLDRCPDNVSLDVCSTAMQLLAHPGVVIVLLGDIEMLESAATRQFKNSGYDVADAKMRGRQYLEKLIQLRIDLPRPTHHMLNTLAAPAGPLDTTVRGNWKKWFSRDYTGSLITIATVSAVLFLALFRPDFFLFLSLAIYILFFVPYLRLGSSIAKVREEIDVQIRARIDAGDRDARTIAAAVNLRDPVAGRSLLLRLTGFFVSPGMTGTGVTTIDAKYVVNRAHALLARRWTADATERGEGDDVHWDALTTAMRSAADVLPPNPRRTKRLLNTIFLQFMLADMRGVLLTRPGQPSSVAANAVPADAVTTWAVITAQWPDLARRLVDFVAAEGGSPPVRLRSLAASDVSEGGGQGLLALLNAVPEIDAHVPTLATMAVTAGIPGTAE